MFRSIHAGPVSSGIQCLSSWASQVVTQPCTTLHGALAHPLSQPVSNNVIQIPGVSSLSSIKDGLGILRNDVNQLYENIVNMTSIQLLTTIMKDLTTYFMYIDVVATKERRQVQALSRPQEESLEGSANTLLHDLEVTLCSLQSAVNIGVDNHIDVNQLLMSCECLDMDDSDYIDKSLRVVHDFQAYINQLILFIGSA
ncbi:hypothetical protein ACJMK2_005124 [Sinanodonta woodiana]|uniref:Uncharacterized protein n=1 Tax=Sinanodonta woodiana TaxID=1069815 RepID=A0ABD3VQD9_SINWO